MKVQDRHRVGKVFLGSAAVMLVVAALFGFGIIPVPPSVRAILASVLGAAAAVEGFFGIRLMGGS